MMRSERDFRPERATGWRPPEDWPRILTVESHAAGEPLRVVVAGWPAPPGASMLERRRHAKLQQDGLRRALMWEPRGHADMYGCVLTPPVSPGADFGVLFTHNEGFSTMCGHGIIAATSVAVDTGMLAARAPRIEVGIDTPAGLVRATAEIEDGRATAVRFLNVPSFVLAADADIEVPGLGAVRFDLAYGGAFYAYVDAGPLGLACTPERYRDLIDAGRAIKSAISSGLEVRHPEDDDLGFLYGTMFTGEPVDPANHSRHVCVFADGEVDRSPTGTGVSGRLAILHARGELPPGERVTFESIIGTRFSGEVQRLTSVGEHPAVIPMVGGRAFLTGRTEHWLDPDDPLSGGFLLR